MFDSQLVRAFKAVAENGSFTAAAGNLGVSQPRVSLLAKRLEDQLGFPLFTRTTRNIRLTPYGAEFLEYASRVLHTMTEAEVTARKLRQRFRGQLRLGAPQFSANVPARVAIIGEYLSANPIDSMHISHGSTEEMLSLLRAGEFDLVFAVSPFGKWDDLEILPISQARLSLGLPPGHELVQMESIPIPLIEGRKIAVLPHTPGDHVFDTWFGPVADGGANFVPAPEALVSTLVQFGQLNNLPVLLYRWSGESESPGDRVIWRPIAAESLTIDLALIKLKTGVLGPTGQRLWDLSADHVRRVSAA